MASYVVMEPPGRADDAVLVRDGFSVFAFFVPLLWLLWHRLWLETLIVLAGAGALALVGALAGLGNASPLPSLLFQFLIGLEGSSLRLAALRRRGWREWGVVEADDAHDAEVRYLTEAADAPDVRAPASAPMVSAPPVRPRIAPALGLFAYPGRG